MVAECSSLYQYIQLTQGWRLRLRPNLKRKMSSCLVSSFHLTGRLFSTLSSQWPSSHSSLLWMQLSGCPDLLKAPLLLLAALSSSWLLSFGHMASISWSGLSRNHLFQSVSVHQHFNNLEEARPFLLTQVSSPHVVVRMQWLPPFVSYRAS